MSAVATAVEQGKVRFFKSDHGYGFIVPDRKLWVDEKGSKRDIFVHFTGILAIGFRELKADQRVEFEVGRDPQGRLIARNVRVIS